jgi:hypothetical protein
MAVIEIELDMLELVHEQLFHIDFLQTYCIIGRRIGEIHVTKEIQLCVKECLNYEPDIFFK